MESMTDSTRLKLLVAIRQLGETVRMSDFTSRLVFQKKVYLLQELGLKLGNSYGWYIYGPYSRDVASDGFQLASIQSNFNDDELERLTTDENSTIQRFQQLLTNAMKIFPNKGEAYCLELLASLLFTFKSAYPRPTNTAVGLENFVRLKPQFSGDATAALNLLEEFNLIP